MINFNVYGITIKNENIGEGGSALVHEALANEGNAFELPVGEQIAVKEFKKTILEIENQVERIRQESEIGQKIRHENIVKTYGLIETEEQEFALIMEYVEGEDLSSWSSKQRKGTAWSKWKQIALDICEAVGTLHDNGVLHRDIKPENIIIKKNRAKLMDIGIACMASPNEHTMHTQLKDFIGSIRYSSPQFLKGDEYTKEDDVYMIGATLLEIFSGKRPYSDIERKIVLPIVMQSSPLRIDKLKEKIPIPIKVLINGALNQDRKRRPTTEDFRSALLNPEESAYINNEIHRQLRDKAGYDVIKITEGGGDIFVDTGNDTPDFSLEYVVIRRLRPLNVPSLGMETEPEMWIANVELRHFQQGIGHFKLIGKRWIEPKNIFSSLSFQTQGRWEEFDKQNLEVKKGDIVVKKQYSES